MPLELDCEISLYFNNKQPFQGKHPVRGQLMAVKKLTSHWEHRAKAKPRLGYRIEK